ncbi:MAG: N-acetylmuramoyl-L-alanine amidase, partial [Terriglobales bacterium]
AHLLHQALLQRPTSERTASDYEAIVAVLRPVWVDPGNRDADSARFEAASIYVSEARDLGQRPAYAKAAQGFLDLLHASPYTAYRRNAEWALAQIQIFHLRAPRAADVWLRDFVHRYPADLRVATAREELRGRDQSEPAYLEPNEPLPVLPRTTPPSVRASPVAIAPRPRSVESPPPPQPEARTDRDTDRNTDRNKDLNHRVGPVDGIHVFSNAQATSVVIALRDMTTFTRGAIPSRHLVYFDIGSRGASAPAASPARLLVNDGRILNIRIAARPHGRARVVIETAPGSAKAGPGRLFPNPARLVVAVTGRRQGDRLPDPAAPPRAAAALASGGSSLTRALGLKVACVVLDAGHGGHDTGTVGSDGLQEKNVVLDVALRLGKLLRQRLGVQVVYTRDDDSFIPLEQRTAIANRAHADLFVSIHANSNQDPGATGVETYYLDLTNNRQAMAVAARENAGSEADVHDLSSLVRKIALNDKMQESHELARDIESSLARGSSQEDRGVKSAPFVVLIGARMPSVLAEISFLSNHGDDRRLHEATFRQKLAEGLYQGLYRYIRSLSSAGTALAERPAAAVK